MLCTVCFCVALPYSSPMKVVFWILLFNWPGKYHGKEVAEVYRVPCRSRCGLFVWLLKMDDEIVRRRNYDRLFISNRL